MSGSFSVEITGSASALLGIQSGFGYTISWGVVNGHFIGGGAPFTVAPASLGLGTRGASLTFGASSSTSPAYLTKGFGVSFSASGGEVMVGGASRSVSVSADGSLTYNKDGSPVVANGVFFGVGVGAPIGASINPTFTTFHTNSWFSFGSPIFTGISLPLQPPDFTNNGPYAWSYQNPYSVYDPSGFMPPTFSGYTGPNTGYNTPSEMGPGPGMPSSANLSTFGPDLNSGGPAGAAATPLIDPTTGLQTIGTPAAPLGLNGAGAPFGTLPATNPLAAPGDPAFNLGGAGNLYGGAATSGSLLRDFICNDNIPPGLSRLRAGQSERRRSQAGRSRNFAMRRRGGAEARRPLQALAATSQRRSDVAFTPQIRCPRGLGPWSRELGDVVRGKGGG